MDISEYNSPWRKVASTIYSQPKDSKLFGQGEIDITEAEKFISNCRKEGLKITMTHVLSAIVGRCVYYDVPELNTFLRRGTIYPRESNDAMVSVIIGDGPQLSSVRVPDIHNKSLKEIAEILNEGITKARQGNEQKFMKSKHALALIPWPFRKLVFRFLKWLSIDNGIAIKWLGLHPNSFGSFIFSNIGSVGVDIGYPALMPASTLAFVFIMGSSEKKPVVINDEIVIRKMMKISACFDHRLVDGYHGGKLFKSIKTRLNNLEELK